MLICLKLLDWEKITTKRIYIKYEKDAWTKLLIYMQVGLNLLIYLLEKWCSPSFEQTWIPFTQRHLVPILVKIVLVVLKKNWWCQYIYATVSPRKRAWSFIWTNVNFLLTRMFCAKLGWLKTSGSGEEDVNVKNLQTVRRTDRRRTTKGRRTADQKSSRELSGHFRLNQSWSK